MKHNQVITGKEQVKEKEEYPNSKSELCYKGSIIARIIPRAE